MTALPADGHSHRHGAVDVGPASARVRAVLALAVGLLGSLTILAVLVLWPRTPLPEPAPAADAPVHHEATVTAVRGGGCEARAPCDAVEVRLESGPSAGRTVSLARQPAGTAVPRVRVGERIIVAENVAADSGVARYSHVDYPRGAPMWLLAAVFAAVVVGIARWRGLASLLGLGITWLVLMWFVVPAILAGESPVVVALAGSSLILFAVLYLAHGINARTTTALVGTLASLAFTVLLASVSVNAARLSGVSSEETMYLAGTAGAGAVNLSGLLLCGIIIGSLGVLNDVTVTQASAVWEVHAANPSQGARRLYRAGMRIGREHIASTVYTLILAYAGAALPLLVLFTVGNERLGDAVGREVVAEEVVRTLVGSVGLIASVPLTTALAAVIVAGERPPAGVDGRPPAGDRVRALAHSATTELSHAPGRLGTAVAETRRQRRSRRDERAAERAATWRAPASEREFWGDER